MQPNPDLLFDALVSASRHASDISDSYAAPVYATYIVLMLACAGVCMLVSRWFKGDPAPGLIKYLAALVSAAVCIAALVGAYLVTGYYQNAAHEDPANRQAWSDQRNACSSLMSAVENGQVYTMNVGQMQEVMEDCGKPAIEHATQQPGSRMAMGTTSSGKSWSYIGVTRTNDGQ